MEKYEILDVIGEGSYGVVHKCRNRETGQVVAIKKFISSEDSKFVKKTFLREVKFLKQLRHRNLVNLREVFQHKKKRYLVFEYVDHTLLDELERSSNGLDEETIRKYLWQLLKAVEFCHVNDIIHRDVKPENILVSSEGVVKLCDFGFARTLVRATEDFTDYVATRWYRAPELLLIDPNYGRPVDVWALGCVVGEMASGDALFQGQSETDQLFIIVKCFGRLTEKLLRHFHSNPAFDNAKPPHFSPSEIVSLAELLPTATTDVLDFVVQCLKLDASDRPSCTELLQHHLFTRDNFAQTFDLPMSSPSMSTIQDEEFTPRAGKIVYDDALCSSRTLVDSRAATRSSMADNKNCTPSPRVAILSDREMEEDRAPTSVSLFAGAVGGENVMLDDRAPSRGNIYYLPPITQLSNNGRAVNPKFETLKVKQKSGMLAPKLLKKDEGFRLPKVEGAEDMKSHNKPKRNNMKPA